MINLKIRRASAEDWKLVRDTYLTLLKTDPQAFADEYGDVADWTEETWKENLNSKTTFLAISSGQTIGIASIGYYEQLPNVPVLHKLGVINEYRGHGVGKELVAAREDWARARGAHAVRVYVMADNEKVIASSKRNEYEIVETLKNNVEKKGNYYDVVVLEKKLS